MFRPYFFAGLIGVEEHHLAYMLGVGLFVGLYLLQKLRHTETVPLAA